MSEGPQYILSMAGVNLAAVLDDTSDLSTIRGGGLLLLDAVKQVEKQLETWAPGALTVSKGASSGLFLLPECTASDAESLTGKVRLFLREHPQLRHFTFAVDMAPMPSEKDFRHAKETVLAKNHWRQMQAPSLAIPQPTGLGPCFETGIRPAEPSKNQKRKSGRILSESFRQRRLFGVTQKQKFYKQWTDLPKLPGFAKDFAGIAKDAPVGLGGLEAKMAVVYMDGNSFGDIERSANTPGELQKFDTDLRNLRKEFLTTLLRDLSGKRNDDSWYRHKRLRFETLLWGGDEMMFVMPAWQGWWFLQNFFEVSKDWKYTDEQGKVTALHHAAGLVFCHHKAPIARIRKLAHDLADHVKDLLGPHKKATSGMAYLVLESYDSLGSSLESFLGETLLQFNGQDKHKQWWLCAENLSAFTKNAHKLLDFPKGRVYRAARQVAETGGYDDKPVFAGLEKDVVSAWKSLAEALPEPKLLPLHLALLWDYLPESKQPNED